MAKSRNTDKGWIALRHDTERVREVQGRRQSNAAGLHVRVRNRRGERRAAIERSARED